VTHFDFLVFLRPPRNANGRLMVIESLQISAASEAMNHQIEQPGRSPVGIDQASF
jgi:hypothetical protein